ncbi:MAG: hypothetical protein JXQ73_21315 [Phycisphaerae bacterium]|nr:hypothetical protein [Phycisphaerae bacterium]
MIYIPIEWWPLAYVCLVPWLVAVTSARRVGWMLLASYLMGAAFFICNAFWLSPITAPAWIAVSLYLGIYFPLVAWLVRYMVTRRRGSVALVLPFVWVGTEWLRAVVVTGFPWFYLAHSHYNVLTMIQVSDLVGAYGLSFVIAAVNGWIVDMLIQPILVLRNRAVRRPRRVPVATVFTAGLLVFTIVYGRAQLASGTMKPGPRTAVCQQDYPVTVSGSRDAAPWQILTGYLKLSLDAGADAPDLIVWPESAGSATLNREFLARQTLVNLMTEEPNELRRMWLSIGQWRGRSNGMPTLREMEALFPNDPNSAKRIRVALAKWYMGKPMDRAAAERLAGLDPKTRMRGGLLFDQWDFGHLGSEVMSALARGRISELREPLGLIGELWGVRADAGLDLANRRDRTPSWVVVGAYGYEFNPDPAPLRAKLDRFNSVYVYDPNGSQLPDRYDKIHCVLFGEYVPFRYSRLHWLYVWLNSITPWGATGFEYSLTAGTKFVAYQMEAASRGGRTYRFAVPICYEDVMPDVCRQFVQSPDGRKNVDFLLNVSNDGWFDHTSELPQHFVASVFRAVENRVGVARAVNTGVSGFIDPMGRIHDRVTDGDRLYGPGIVGARVSTIFTDTRHSLYTRWGDWFAHACTILLALMAVDAAVVGRLLSRRRTS